MKVISEGKDSLMRGVCQSCGCVFDFSHKDGERILNQKFKWYYRVICPNNTCGKPTAVYA